MNTVLFHFVSGDAFFSGLLVVAAGAVVIGASGGKRRRSGSAMILIGWVLIVASATAHLVVSYVCLACLSLPNVWRTFFRSATRSRSGLA